MSDERDETEPDQSESNVINLLDEKRFKEYFTWQIFREVREAFDMSDPEE
jgi:hypothetical protein